MSTAYISSLVLNKFSLDPKMSIFMQIYIELLLYFGDYIE